MGLLICRTLEILDFINCLISNEWLIVWEVIRTLVALEREQNTIYEMLSTCLSQYLSTCSHQQVEDSLFIIGESLCCRAAAQVLRSSLPRPHHSIASCKNESYLHPLLEFNVNVFFTNVRSMTTPKRERERQGERRKNNNNKDRNVIRAAPWDQIHQDSILEAVMELWPLFFFLSPIWCKCWKAEQASAEILYSLITRVGNMPKSH